MKENKMATMNIPRLFFAMALPAIVGQVINLLYNMVDRIFVGQMPEVGALAITGMGVSMPIITLISAFSSFVGMGASPLAAMRMGEGKTDEAERILSNSVSLLLGFSIILTAIFYYFRVLILTAFGASENTLPYALEYTEIYVLGTVFVQLALGLNPMISCQGYALTSMLTVTIGAVLNIILDPILIYGFDMGVRGAAIATVFSQAVSAFWVIRFLGGHKSKIRIRRRWLRPQLKTVSSILLLGISPFIMQSTESLLTVTFNRQLLQFGSDLYVGAMSILATVSSLMFLPLVGFTQGAGPILSFNYGARDPKRVREAFKVLFTCCMGYSMLFYVLIMLFPTPIVRLFTADQTLINATLWALRIYMALYFILGAQIACQQSFIALGQARISLFLALLRKIILLIPLILLLPNFFQDKVFAVFLAEPVADLLAAMCTVIFFFRFFNQKMREMEASVEG